MDRVKEDIPGVGWKVRMDHTFTQTRIQRVSPTFMQALRMIPLGIRYFLYYIYWWFRGRTVVMDYFRLAQADVKRGAPLGGIGSGTMGRSYLGDFCNFQMVPGFYELTTPLADQFIATVRDSDGRLLYQKVVCVKDKIPDGLKTWDWGFPAEDGEYTALYPRSWYVYNIKKHSIKLVCRQISPVIPDNYKDSCIPGAVFVWTVINMNEFDVSVSITFTFQNGDGSHNDRCGSVTTKSFDSVEGECKMSGVEIRQNLGGVDGSYVLACCNNDNVITRCTYFDPNGSGKTIWNNLRTLGELKEDSQSVTKVNQQMGVAVCSRFLVSARSSKSTQFALVWAFPFARFPCRNDVHLKFYTKYFGKGWDAGATMALYCLKHYGDWEKSIDQWQKPILENSDLPDWYKQAIFNELYYVSDGGSLWLLPFQSDSYGSDDPRSQYGHFAYLEGQEYRMYNTYDVHFYASFALAMLWPKLQLSLQYDMRDSIDEDNPQKMWYLADGSRSERKKRHTLPHDIGDPAEDPFFLVNSYPVHDVSEWRDLNLKFVLQVYRDFTLHKDERYLKDMFPQVKSVMKKSLTFDKDGDGMIENSGTADQTYDCWVMSGTSAYCGGLWLAALHATTQIADILEDTECSNTYSKILEKAKEAFDKKLWNGKYYNFDCSSGTSHESIMADQLCGVWYLKCSDPAFYLLPEAKVKSSLMTVYENNVMKYFGGQQGAVNGMMPNGVVDRESIQSEEMWIGVTFALSSLLISEGYVKEGFKTAEGLINTLYNRSKLAFCSPEALHGQQEFRSLAYMRPLCIWSIQLALDNIRSKH